MAKGGEKRIEALRVKRDQLDAEISRLQAKSRTESRKADTRRKILVGAVVMKEMEFDTHLAARVDGLLRDRLTKPRDRALFEFPSM